MKDYLLTCPRGLEEVTNKDISKFIKQKPQIVNGGIKFQGQKKDMYAVNLFSRTGMHLLEKLFYSKIYSPKKLYSIIYDFPWHKFIKSDTSFMIKTKIKSTLFNKSNTVTLKIKDAIVDNIRKNFGRRPSINKESPDLSLYVIILENNITIYINTSGIPLFKRGYRAKIHRAGLNESLAAGLVLLSNWNSDIPFYDIMCGSGTIPIEAAMIAHKIPPRINRKYYAFKKLKNYDSSLLDSLIEKSKNKIIDNKNFSIFGSDHIKANISLAYESSKLIDLKNNIQLSVKNIKDFIPNEKGTIIINPPYGHRLGDPNAIKILYKQLGDLFKTKCAGCNVFVFSGNLDAIKSIGLRSKSRTILKNGKIDSRFLHYPMKDGSYK
tara:strand:- start:12751 stop:13887 length:1137 start_codon:yes stop_codon:yes gene_type:complete